MERVFDPYHKWLGIPPEEQPPNHYRLLGLRDVEADPDVIQAGADQRMAHLRTYQTGRYSDWSQRLLNEVATARICLLNPARKAAYDQQLQAATPPAEERPEPAPVAQSFLVAVDAPRPRVSSTLHGKKRVPLGTFITGSVTLVGALILGLVYFNAQPPEVPAVGVNPACGDARAIGEAVQPRSPSSLAKKKPCMDVAKILKPNGVAAPSSSSDATRTNDAASRRLAQAKLSMGRGSESLESIDSDASDGSDREPSETFSDVDKTDTEEPDSTESTTLLPDQTETELASNERVAVPTAAAQEEAMNLARDLYKAEFDEAKTADEKLALAKKLLAQADAATSADAGTFVLLQLAKDMALQASDGETAFAAVDLMAEQYQIDPVSMKAEWLAMYAKKARGTPQHLLVAEQAARLFDEASAAGNYEQAVALAKLIASEAALGRNKELVLWAKGCVQDLQKNVKLAAPIGRWFSLLPSQNQLVGWEVNDCHFSYANRVIDQRQGDMYCPIVAKDVSIRAKVQRRNASCVRLILRNSKEGCYMAQLTSSRWSIIKLTRSPVPDAAPGQFLHWGEEDTLNAVAVTRNYSGIVFEMGFAAIGDTLTVFLNRQPLLQAKDATWAEGCVGVGTTNATGLSLANVEMLIPKNSLVEDRRAGFQPATISAKRKEDVGGPQLKKTLMTRPMMQQGGG